MTSASRKQWMSWTVHTLVVVALAILASVILRADAAAVTAERRRTPPPSKRCTDFFKCTLMDQIYAAERFLSSHKNGQPYTPEARTLDPFAETVRLNIDTQALGYLNLYKLTDARMYRREAESRLDYILQLGNAALRNSAFDGQIGYSFLVAAEATNNQAYRVYGLQLADRCLTYANNVMNWGYMCAMNLGKAYALTGDVKYLTASRAVTRGTGNKQFSDGAFPHRDSKSYGENAGYTSWLMFEMFQHRQDDADNPDMDPAIIKALPFLAQRVNADGSLNYQDANGSYYSDPGNADGRGWTNDLASIGYNLTAGGRTAEAQRALQFLFRQGTAGSDRGGYPDKWDFVDPSNQWTTGRPSVLRTSLIFWYLTSIPLISNACPNGTQQSCAVTPTDCHPAYQELGLCNQGLTGARTCLNGVATKCLNAAAVQYQPNSCTAVVFYNCIYDEAGDTSDTLTCTKPGDRKCVGSACGDFCISPDSLNPECVREQFQGDVCSQ